MPGARSLGRLATLGAAAGALTVPLFLLGVGPRSADAIGTDSVDEISANYGGNPATSVWLHWRGTETTVNYGTDTSYGLTAIASASPITPVDVSGPFQRVLLAGLSAGTVYHYQIGATGADHTVKTAPEGDAVWDDVGDTGSMYYATGSTAGCNKTWMASIWQQLASDNADFYTHGGDISYANVCGNAATHQLFNDIAPVSTTRVIEWSEGNHEYGSTNGTSPPGTVRDSLANYKGRWNMAHPQVEPNDTGTQTTHPGCTPTPGQTTNGCQGEDWGWFDVGHYRFISRPEPDVGAYPDWQAKADAIMADAESNPNIYGIITFGHRPACSSLRDSTGAWSSDVNVMTAVNALGDRYSPVARPDGKYLLDVGHHIHGAEVCSPQHGVWELTDGAGGTDEVNFTATNPASLWKSNHFAHIRAQLVGNQVVISYVCGPVFTIMPTKAPACTMDSTMYALTITSPIGPQPSPTPTPTPSPTPTPTPTPTGPYEYVGNASLETDLTGWTGVYNSMSRNTRVAGGYDGLYSLHSVNNSAATGTAGFIDKPHWLNLASSSGVVYTATALVSADKTAEKFALYLRELNPAGVTVGSKTVTLTATSTAWVKITAAYTAVASGDTIAFYLSASNLPAHQGFRADLLSLTSPQPPAGKAATALLLLLPPAGGLLGALAYVARPRRHSRHGRPGGLHALQTRGRRADLGGTKPGT